MNNSLEGSRNPAARKALIRYHRNKNLALKKNKNHPDPVREFKVSELMSSGGVRPGKWADWGHSTHRRNGVPQGAYHL